AFAREASPPWAAVQARVGRIVAERLGPGKAAELPRGIQQIWLPQLDRVDRCTTCHLTMAWGSALADVPNPARSHPRPELIATHPFERFGCTLCHGGQGQATTRAAAHGNAPFWDEPVLTGVRAQGYGLSAAEMLETRCNTCHQREAAVKGMVLLDEAKAQVRKRRCVRCHRIQGEGASKGPDLTHVGEQHPGHLVFPPGWYKPRTALYWHIAHFLDPKAMSPNTEMPKFTLTERQAAGLALLVMSWKRLDLPPAWIPPAKGEAKDTPKKDTPK
ncbi:MAG: cytochrome c family protein, partial [Planctomycetota bacterium]